MTKDVVVTVTGLDIDAVDAEPLEIVTTGKYLNKKDHGIVRFDVVMEGMGLTHNTVRFNREHAELVRSGAVAMYMYFYPGRKTDSDYKTPFGDMLISLNTTGYELKEAEDSIGIDIRYELSLNHEFLANCGIAVKIRPLI